MLATARSQSTRGALLSYPVRPKEARLLFFLIEMYFYFIYMNICPNACLLYIYMCLFYIYEYLSECMSACNAHGGQERALDSLLRHHMGAGNYT